MRKVIACVCVIILLILCSGCERTYTVTGKVVSTKCEEKTRYNSSSIKLDNGVTYNDGGNYGCKIDKGTKVTIIHNDNMKMYELIVEGTVKNKEEKK